MINPEEFYSALQDSGVEFFTGVPDSLLKSFCAVVSDKSDKNHIIAANEGNSIAIAAGNQLATGKLPLVYMQNSGLGNCVNPLTSLTDKEVYSIPMLLMIGWRGEPGVKDEPQHVKMGKISKELLETMGVSYFIIDSDTEDFKNVINAAVEKANVESAPVAFLVKKGSFDSYKGGSVTNDFPLTREEACEAFINNLKSKDDIIVSTTGKLSRELYEIRERLSQSTNDFYNVGSMGHVSQIALGIALSKPNKRVFCFDGDGAALMHLGGMAIIGSMEVSNMVHVVFNNSSHESVGGQPTVGNKVSFEKLSSSFGYKRFFQLNDLKSIESLGSELEHIKGPTLIEININTDSRTDLGRPKTTPIENKKLFVQKLNE